MKKKFSLLLTLVLLVIAFTACTGNDWEQLEVVDKSSSSLLTAVTYEVKIKNPLDKKVNFTLVIRVYKDNAVVKEHSFNKTIVKNDTQSFTETILIEVNSDDFEVFIEAPKS